jgi:hypothetical protein
MTFLTRDGLRHQASFSAGGLRNRDLAIRLPLGVAALALAGCVEKPYTPSDLVAQAEPEPQARRVQLPRRDDLIGQWQLPPGDPWAPYEKLTLLTALESSPDVIELPDVDALDEVQAAGRAAARVAQAGLPNDTLWIVDLRGAASVAFATGLSRGSDRTISVIPTFNNWPADNELVPAEETLAAMVAMPPRAIEPTGQVPLPVFVLDSWRLAYKSEPIDGSVIDNRYMLSASDFPSVEALRSQGLSRVVYVVADAGSRVHEEDDLNDLFQTYSEAGIEIDMADLAWLSGGRVLSGSGWWFGLHECRLEVRARPTVVHDLHFYIRARGGFGGEQARPFGLAHPWVAGHVSAHPFAAGIGGG